MKKFITAIFVFILLAFVTKTTRAQGNQEQEAAIKALIEGGSQAFAKRDYDAWEKCWLHDESVSHVLASNFYHHELRGWSEIDSLIGAIIKNQPPIMPGIHKNYQYRINGDLATVSYDGYSQSEDGKLSEIQEKGFRTLVKRDGEWKIVQVIGTMPSTYSMSAEWDINTAGYSLLNDGRIDEAIKVFELNTTIFPESANVWDSLGEAQMAAGQTESAIKNYKKSLAIDSTNTNATKMIERLRQNKQN